MEQSAIGHHDLCTQIQKFWNICSNLNFKEDSFYPFPSLFRNNKLWNGAFFLHHQPWSGKGKAVWTIFVSLKLVTTLCYPNSNPVLVPDIFKNILTLMITDAPCLSIMKSGKHYEVLACEQVIDHNSEQGGPRSKDGPRKMMTNFSWGLKLFSLI